MDAGAKLVAALDAFAIRLFPKNINNLSAIPAATIYPARTLRVMYFKNHQSSFKVAGALKRELILNNTEEGVFDIPAMLFSSGLIRIDYPKAESRKFPILPEAYLGIHHASSTLVVACT